MKTKATAAVCAALLALAAGAAGAAELGTLPALPDTVRDYPGFDARIYRDGRVLVAGQPDSAAVAALPEHGVTCVVNLRTPEEMENRKRVPFDEAARVAALGVDYVWIPLGGDDHPYTAAAVDSFAAALDAHPGPVLLHCASGGRAANMWVAYLVRHQGWNFAAALARGQAIAIRESPLAGLLERPVRLVLTDE